MASIVDKFLQKHVLDKFLQKHVFQDYQEKNMVRLSLFYFLYTDFFGNKLGSEEEIKMKIKFIRTIFQVN